MIIHACIQQECQTAYQVMIGLVVQFAMHLFYMTATQN